MKTHAKRNNFSTSNKRKRDKLGIISKSYQNLYFKGHHQESKDITPMIENTCKSYI